ncbi:MAG: hypothetical protein ABH834_04855 [Candidatus Altiarchaeota archaeon]
MSQDLKRIFPTLVFTACIFLLLMILYYGNAIEKIKPLFVGLQATEPYGGPYGKEVDCSRLHAVKDASKTECFDIPMRDCTEFCSITKSRPCGQNTGSQVCDWLSDMKCKPVTCTTLKKDCSDRNLEASCSNAVTAEQCDKTCYDDFRFCVWDEAHSKCEAFYYTQCKAGTCSNHVDCTGRRRVWNCDTWGDDADMCNKRCQSEGPCRWDGSKCYIDPRDSCDPICPGSPTTTITITTSTKPTITTSTMAYVDCGWRDGVPSCSGLDIGDCTLSCEVGRTGQPCKWENKRCIPDPAKICNIHTCLTQKDCSSLTAVESCALLETRRCQAYCQTIGLHSYMCKYRSINNCELDREAKCQPGTCKTLNKVAEPQILPHI